jgi:hypothetical protein
MGEIEVDTMSMRMLWKIHKNLDIKERRKKLQIHFRPIWTEWYHNIWWKIVPGTEIKICWPDGPVIKSFEDQYMSDQELFSADPNDHYRPWIEHYVGCQGWDWDWALRDNDVLHNVLTIKFRKGKDQWASIAAMKWS